MESVIEGNLIKKSLFDGLAGGAEIDEGVAFIVSLPKSFGDDAFAYSPRPLDEEGATAVILFSTRRVCRKSSF